MTTYSAAPTGDEPLTPDDAVKVLEEILEAQNQSRFLGLKLNVPDYIVTGIHTRYIDPKDRLYYILVEFLRHADPKPTWRAIVAALRSPAVSLPQLAMKVEAAHFPDPTAIYNTPPTEGTTCTSKVTITTKCPPSETITPTGMDLSISVSKFILSPSRSPDVRSVAISHAINTGTSSTLKPGEMVTECLAALHYYFIFFSSSL